MFNWELLGFIMVQTVGILQVTKRIAIFGLHFNPIFGLHLVIFKKFHIEECRMKITEKLPLLPIIWATFLSNTTLVKYKFKFDTLSR